MKRLILTIVAIVAIVPSIARETFSLNDDWQFFFKVETSSDYARNISLPHTWNLDALAGRHGEYRQTTANYSREIYIPSEWLGKRLFLKFYGVQSVADVFVNGHHAGEHRGGWTAFSIEITNALRYGANNSLLVVVSNAYQNDILPTSSEENLYGGIYRDVELIVTEPTTISPLYYGSDGVFIHQNQITDNMVEATASVWVTTLHDKACDLAITVRAPSGEAVYTEYIKGRIEENKPINIPFTIEEPLLWSCQEPNLYTVTIGIGLRQQDEVTVTTGFRTVEHSKQGIKINGEYVPIHGVTLHHDRAAVGSALRSRHYDEDLEQITDVGANAIRSSTAPHAQYLYDRCDEMGLLAWIDTPFTRAPYLSDMFYFATDKFHKNGLHQLHEVILQNYNHPSVIMWGIFSLVWERGNNVSSYVRELNATAKRLDSSRPTVACSNQDGDINFITDLIVWQQNVGWERGTTDDLQVWRKNLHKKWKHLHSATAYGEGASIDQQTEERVKPTRIAGGWLPERWQTEFHEGYTKHIAPDSIFWGVWINDMFDFGSARNISGLSQRGLVTFDRKDCKDAYYLYRALWNKKSPTLHISEKRRNIRQDSIQQVKFYSSAKQAPVLLINKDTVATREYAPCQFISDSVVMHGRNKVAVYAGELCDSQIITIGNALKQRR